MNRAERVLWTPEEDALLEQAYRAGGSSTAADLFPTRTFKAVDQRLTHSGIRKKVLAELAAQGKTIPRPPRVYDFRPRPVPRSVLGKVTPISQPSRRLAPVTDLNALREGSCDPGDMEHIRKRILRFVIPELSRELRRTPFRIKNAITRMVEDGGLDEGLLPSLSVAAGDAYASQSEDQMPSQRTQRGGRARIL